jgi:Flp pilus assembly protein CpaB
VWDGGAVRRSNLLVIAGVAFFVVGVVIVALLQRDDSKGSTVGQTVDVLVAKEDIPAGTNGSDATTKVEIQKVTTSEKHPDALSAPSELGNEVFTEKFSKGEQVRTAGLRQLSRVATVEIPQGKEEVAVQVPFAAGGACYIAPGDTVNVYQVFPTQQPTAPVATPHTQLLLTKVKVLDISCQAAPLGTPASATTPTTAATGVVTRSGSTSDVTVLLAVDSTDAEKIIFGSHSNDSFLYLTRVDPNAQPSAPTPGRDYTSIFNESPDAANARDH